MATTTPDAVGPRGSRQPRVPHPARFSEAALYDGVRPAAPLGTLLLLTAGLYLWGLSRNGNANRLILAGTAYEERAVHREARQSPGATCRGRPPAASGDSGIGGEQLGLGWNPPGRRGSPQVDRSLLRPPRPRLTVGQVIEVVGVPDTSRSPRRLVARCATTGRASTPNHLLAPS